MEKQVKFLDLNSKRNGTLELNIFRNTRAPGWWSSEIEFLRYCVTKTIILKIQNIVLLCTLVLRETVTIFPS